MGERISTQEVAYDIKTRLIGLSPLVAMLSWLPPSQILLGRENQRWLVTIQEIPSEHE